MLLLIGSFLHGKSKGMFTYQVTVARTSIFSLTKVVFAKTLASGARIRVHLGTSIFKPSV
jgi:hypothetical protein